MLESLGLREAVRSWAKDYAERSAIPLTIDIPDEIPRLPEDSPIGLFRIAQEAITNAVRHAKASAIRLSMRVEKDQVILTVVDNGVGIAAHSSGADRPQHGLLAMRERAIAMGGMATIGGGRGGRGTEVRVTAPLEKIR
jgi:signal transduction histidine kinase